jgi:hypothetical protein
MFELTHPVELRDEQLDLIAAGGGSPPPHNGGDKCCGGDTENRQALIYLEDVNVLNNIALVNFGGQFAV